MGAPAAADDINWRVRLGGLVALAGSFVAENQERKASINSWNGGLVSEQIESPIYETYWPEDSFQRRVRITGYRTETVVRPMENGQRDDKPRVARMRTIKNFLRVGGVAAMGVTFLAPMGDGVQVRREWRF